MLTHCTIFFPNWLPRPFFGAAVVVRVRAAFASFSLVGRLLVDEGDDVDTSLPLEVATDHNNKRARYLSFFCEVERRFPVICSMNLNSRAILRPVKPDRTLSPPTLMITMPGETEFTTPQAKRSKLSSSFDTPNTSSLTHSAGSSSSSFEIPPTPCLKRLGFGTGRTSMSG